MTKDDSRLICPACGGGKSMARMIVCHTCYENDPSLADKHHHAPTDRELSRAGEPYAPAPAPEQEGRRKSLLDGLSSAERKQYPVTTGVMDYFRDAILGIAHVSFKGNEKHNPGEPLHWARNKSTDDVDAAGRHLIERDEIDSATGLPVSVQLAWRACAVAQKDLEKMFNIKPPRGCSGT